MQISDLKQRQKSLNKQQNGEKRSAAAEKKKEAVKRASPFSPDAKLCVSLMCLALSLSITWSVHSYFKHENIYFPSISVCFHLSSQAASSAGRKTSRNDRKVRVSAGEEPQCSGSRRETDWSLTEGLCKSTENTNNRQCYSWVCAYFIKTFTPFLLNKLVWVHFTERFHLLTSFELTINSTALIKIKKLSLVILVTMQMKMLISWVVIRLFALLQSSATQFYCVSPSKISK